MASGRRVVGVGGQTNRPVDRLAAMLRDGTASRGRLGDLVHARYLFWELDSHLRAGLERYGIDGDDFFSHGKEWLSGFLDDIPSAAITMTLTEKGFRNADKAWKGNDLRDADAMSAAIPYCDVVLTDKYAAAQLAGSPAVTRLGTLSCRACATSANGFPASSRPGSGQRHNADVREARQ